MNMKWPITAKWTENDVSDKGYNNRERIDSAIARSIQFLTDPEKKKRIKANLCICCFYGGSSICGQAFTEWNCRACLKDQPIWPNTATPLICDDCSNKHKLCTQCGADLFLRVKRSNVILLSDKNNDQT